MADDVAKSLAPPLRKTRGGQAVYADLISRYGPDIELILPPPKNAILGGKPQRDKHIEQIVGHGRMKWQTDTNYNRGARIKAQIGRWMAVIGGSLQGRNLDNQNCETSIGSKALNRMTGLARAKYERV